MDATNVHQVTDNPLLDLKWKEIEVKKTRANLRIFQLGDEPEIVYIFESGYIHPQMYHVIFEDAYEAPITSRFLSKEQIKEQLKIDL